MFNYETTETTYLDRPGLALELATDLMGNLVRTSQRIENGSLNIESATITVADRFLAWLKEQDSKE